MTVAEILREVGFLSEREKLELKLALLNAIETSEFIRPRTSPPKTGPEIVAHLRELGPIELVDSHITDPVEWVKAQRKKEEDRLRAYWDADV